MSNRINSTRFLNQEELASQLLEVDINEKNYPGGGIPLLTMGDKIYVDATDSHSIIFGATGSKKTRMFAMPSIGIFARAGESFVVTDPKGELFQRTSGEVAEMGYEVCCLNLRNMKAGESWNPFYLPYKLYHGGERAKAMEMVQQMASMMTEDSNEDKFWTHTTIDVLCGMIFYLFETETETKCTLLSLNALWDSYIERRKTFLNKVEEKFGNTMISRKLSSLNNSSDKTVGSIEAIVSMALNRIMVNEEMMKYLSGNSINLEELAKKKTAIYLVIPDENKTYHFVVSIFLEQLYEALIKEAHTKKNNMLEIRMNFLIDEFANIPKIENMDSMITASRSRNIRFHLIIQSMKQLRHKYEEYADVICSNCNNWVYLYSKEYELLQEISRLCGEVIYDNGLRVPLFSEFDLQHLAKEKGEALVLAGRNFPCLSNLKDIDEYPFAKGETTSGRQKAPEKMETVKQKPVSEPSMEVPEGTIGVVAAVGGEAGIPEQIILLADTCKMEELDRFIEKKQKGLATIYGLKESNIAWYVVDSWLIGYYQEQKKEEPGRFYSMVESFYFADGISKESISVYKKETEMLCADKDFEFELWKRKGETRRILFKEFIPDFGGQFGLLFAKKQMLYIAKKKMEELGYESGRWELVKSDQCEWVYRKTQENDFDIYLKLYRERGGRGRRSA